MPFFTSSTTSISQNGLFLRVPVDMTVIFKSRSYYVVDDCEEDVNKKIETR